MRAPVSWRYMTHLQSRALVCQLPDPVEDEVDDLLADSVVTPGVVVGRVLLASDKLFRMKQLTVRTSTDFVCINTCVRWVLSTSAFATVLRQYTDALQLPIRIY